MISVEVLADSVGPTKHHERVTTFLWRYPKFIHAEVLTHRTFSRNSSSSRAIPTARYLAEVRDLDQRAEPAFWGAERRGMSPGDELTGVRLVDVQGYWSRAAICAAEVAENMARCGAHKSIINRVLDPFVHVTTVVTSTASGYANFLGLRLDENADPTIRVLAHEVLRAWRVSTPVVLIPGEWHLPFIDVSEHPQDLENLLMVSTARCARTSYASFEHPGVRSCHTEDLKLFEKLVGSQPLHASPAEHQCSPDDRVESHGWVHPERHGNLPGYVQHRKMLPGEAQAGDLALYSATGRC